MCGSPLSNHQRKSVISFVICNLSNFLCFGQFDAVFRFFRSIHHTSDDTGDPRRRGSITQGSIVKKKKEKKIIFQQTKKRKRKKTGNKKERKKITYRI